MKKATREKKLSLEQLVEKMDSAKKVNPLDLSSDQDLTIALMNLVSLEEHFFFSGAKTRKTGFYDMINTVREMRKELMARIVKKSSAENGEVWCISKHLLAASMRLMEVGTKALGAGNAEEAYAFFNKAYDLYSLFWGLNMDLIDLSGVEQTVPEFYQGAMGECKLRAEAAKSGKAAKGAKSVSADAQHKTTVRKLGDWVKNAVNCCIE